MILIVWYEEGVSVNAVALEVGVAPVTIVDSMELLTEVSVSIVVVLEFVLVSMPMISVSTIIS